MIAAQLTLDFPAAVDFDDLDVEAADRAAAAELAALAMAQPCRCVRGLHVVEDGELSCWTCGRRVA